MALIENTPGLWSSSNGAFLLAGAVTCGPRQQILKFSAAKDADNHNYAEKSRDKISDKTDSRITEDKRFYPGGYDHGAANNQGGENNGKRKTIADIIQTFLQAAQIFMPEPDIQVTLFNFLQNTLNSTRQIALQLEIKT